MEYISISHIFWQNSTFFPEFFKTNSALNVTSMGLPRLILTQRFRINGLYVNIITSRTCWTDQSPHVLLLIFDPPKLVSFSFRVLGISIQDNQIFSFEVELTPQNLKNVQSHLTQTATHFSKNKNEKFFFVTYNFNLQCELSFFGWFLQKVVLIKPNSFLQTQCNGRFSNRFKVLWNSFSCSCLWKIGIFLAFWGC